MVFRREALRECRVSLDGGLVVWGGRCAKVGWWSWRSGRLSVEAGLQIPVFSPPTASNSTRLLSQCAFSLSGFWGSEKAESACPTASSTCLNSVQKVMELVYLLLPKIYGWVLPEKPFSAHSAVKRTINISRRHNFLLVTLISKVTKIQSSAQAVTIKILIKISFQFPSSKIPTSGSCLLLNFCLFFLNFGETKSRTEQLLPVSNKKKEPFFTTKL